MWYIIYTLDKRSHRYESGIADIDELLRSLEDRPGIVLSGVLYHIDAIMSIEQYIE